MKNTAIRSHPLRRRSVLAAPAAAAMAASTSAWMATGQEVTRVFTEHHDIHVLNFLPYNFRDLRGAAPGCPRSAKCS